MGSGLWWRWFYVVSEDLLCCYPQLFIRRAVFVLEYLANLPKQYVLFTNFRSEKSLKQLNANCRREREVRAGILQWLVSKELYSVSLHLRWSLSRLSKEEAHTFRLSWSTLWTERDIHTHITSLVITCVCVFVWSTHRMAGGSACSSLLDCFLLFFFLFLPGKRPGNRRFSVTGDGEADPVPPAGDGERLVGLLLRIGRLPGEAWSLILLRRLLGARLSRTVQLVRRVGCCCRSSVCDEVAKFASVDLTTAIMAYMRQFIHWFLKTLYWLWCTDFSLQAGSISVGSGCKPDFADVLMTDTLTLVC